MNIELLLEIRDWLVMGCPGQWDFDMNVYVEVETTETGWCGTACCLAGAALLFGDKTCLEITLDNICSTYKAGEPVWWTDNVEELAAQLLGLDEETANQLFFPWCHNLENPLPDDLPPSQAALVIENLIATGNVNWHL